MWELLSLGLSFSHCYVQLCMCPN
uniref:Uncharacterized protein n=1 Tax=Arundo donax TaxID=35708 RepID=A0A0A9HGB0_ARUDO